MTQGNTVIKDVIKRFVTLGSTTEQEDWTEPQIVLVKAEVLVNADEPGESVSLLVDGGWVGTLHLMEDGSVEFEITYDDRAATIVVDGKVVEREG